MGYNSVADIAAVSSFI